MIECPSLPDFSNQRKMKKIYLCKDNIYKTHGLDAAKSIAADPDVTGPGKFVSIIHLQLQKIIICGKKRCQ